MQLIFDTEASVDIKEKMSSLDESSEKSLNDGIEPLKAAISNGNKENIQCTENIIKSTENVTNGIDKDDINDGIEAPLLDDDKTLLNNEKVPSADAQGNSDSTDVKTNGTTIIEESDKQDTDQIDNNKDETFDSIIGKQNKNELNDILEVTSVGVNVENNLESKNDALTEDDNSKSESDNVEKILEKVNDSQMEEASTEQTETSETILNDEISTELLAVASSLETPVNIEQEDTTENVEINLVDTKMEVSNTYDSKIYREDLVETESSVNIQGDDMTDSSKINEYNSVETESPVNVQGDDITDSSKIIEENPMETESFANVQDNITDSSKINEGNPNETESSVNIHGVNITDSSKINEGNLIETECSVNIQGDDISDSSKSNEENPIETESSANVQADDISDSSKINEGNLLETESSVNIQGDDITDSLNVNKENPIDTESSVNVQGDDITDSSKINEENLLETESSANVQDDITNSSKINEENLLETEISVNIQGDDITDSSNINEENPMETESSVNVQGDDITDSSKINEENPIETKSSVNIQGDDITDNSKIDEENPIETESSVNIQGDDISDSSKINEENPGVTEMEVDVSQPELSTMECESLNENDMECNDTIEKGDQSTLVVDEEEVLKNTENHNVIDEVEDNVVNNTSVIDTEISNTLSHDELIKEGSANNKDIVLQKSSTSNNEEILEQASLNETGSVLSKKGTIADQDLKVMEIVSAKTNTVKEAIVTLPETAEPKKKLFSKLSNTLDILSDDEDDVPTTISNEKETSKPPEKQCINIEDDDDIMLIDEDVASKDCSSEPAPQTTDLVSEKKDEEKCAESITNLENNTDNVESGKTDEPVAIESKAYPSPEMDTTMDIVETKEEEKPKDTVSEIVKIDKPLLPANFLKAYKKNLADMTREDLEEFCILKIVESIVDRSNLSDIKTKLKEMAQNIEEYKKKALMLTKQNRDLQVVVKSVQEEQKKFADNPAVIKPLKITRSVGMQVLVNDKPGMRKKTTATVSTNANTANTPNNRNPRAQNQNPKLQKSPAVSQTIPVPRLVPANNPVGKISAPTIQSAPTSAQTKTPSPAPNGVRNSPPVQKTAEKRPISRTQAVTVDLTDDEPPTKIAPRSSPAPPVRIVSPQNLLAARPTFGQTLNSPRKVYIPISGPQNPGARSGPAIMLKSVAAGGPGVRPRLPPHIARMPQNTIRMPARAQSRHPAPLPDAVKQYQPPNWKALPPAPDLKLSKVENGIVISWKIEGYQEDSYEEIASYQLYAYQETSSPPNTALWKKIGDVKALPLPMACTLTHVMAGFKYYFAVRAVDIRSRLGPFSLPGSILLLNKL